MATFASFLSYSLPFSRRRRSLRRATSFFSTSIPRSRICSAPRRIHTSVISSSLAGTPFDEINSFPDSSSKKSVVSELIQEIEPLDISLIQKDVPSTTIDAMKRTISGMLGLLPSDQFQVYVEALWEPLSKLLVSSMVTGYTLRNAEYRLFLEKNLDLHEQSTEQQTTGGSQLDVPEILLDSAKKIDTGKSDMLSRFGTIPEDTPGDLDLQGLGDIPYEAHEYILHLQTRLSSVKKELHEVKRKNAALQMQQFVGEEKNDLLDYLRSLQPEKVAELSEPTSPELRDTIHSVVHGLLATLSPRMQSQPPPSSDNTSVKASADSEDCAELVENTSLHFQPLISLTRDYLARLLFWCMLMGHYLRGLEYRLELAELLSLKAEPDDPSGEQAT